MKQYLPLGSIVLLKGGKKRIMICGRIQKKVGEDTLYDYAACYYPEGIVDSKSLFLFNHEEIETVYFVGMQDVEEFRFRAFLEGRLNPESLSEERE